MSLRSQTHRPAPRNPRRQCGSTLVEFAFICLLLFVVLFAALELGRMIVVYTTVANAARVGVRYAIVHGSTNTGAGDAGPSGASDTTAVENVVKDYAKVGLLDTGRLDITVTYPDGGLNSPGSRVSVKVVYPYDPFTVLPLGVTLGTTTQGVITF